MLKAFDDRAHLSCYHHCHCCYHVLCAFAGGQIHLLGLPLQGCFPEGGSLQNQPGHLGRPGSWEHSHEIYQRTKLLARPRQKHDSKSSRGWLYRIDGKDQDGSQGYKPTGDKGRGGAGGIRGLLGIWSVLASRGVWEYGAYFG